MTPSVVCKATWLLVSVLTPSMISISPPTGQFCKLAVQKAGHDPQTLGFSCEKDGAVRIGDVTKVCDDEDLVELVLGLESHAFATGRGNVCGIGGEDEGSI